jgi:hypothetical protein
MNPSGPPLPGPLEHTDLGALAFQGPRETQRQEAQQGGSAAEVLTVLAVEQPRVPLGLLSGLIALGATGAAPARASPHHRLGLG